MAIRKRVKDVSDIKKVDDSKSSTFSVSENNNHQKINDDEILKSWRDEAIKTLNILDAKGINIYDESRTPGMYVKARLKRYYGTGSDNAPKSIVEVLTGKSSPQKKTKEQEEQIPDDLTSKLLKAMRK
jgi:hypothetical protein